MSGREVRAELDHPVIDSDAHYVEYGPMLVERLRKIGGDAVAEAFDGFQDLIGKPLAMTPEQREHHRVAHMGFWQIPMDAYDRATAMMPALFAERMDEIGLDFCVMYPTGGLAALFMEAEIRQKCARAFNTFVAEYFAPHADRMTPVAIIPAHTPDEAIGELDYAVNELGLKAVLINAVIRRPSAAALEGDEDAIKQGPWYDVLALDSLYDYDPVWAKCVELGIAPTFHSAARSWGLRNSPSNYVYNHVGHFAAAGNATAKAIFLGGVTRRFPALRFAFLEGGASWACQLYTDLIEHWEKRNGRAIQHLNPDRLDCDRMLELARQYGPSDMVELLTADRESALFGAMNAFASTETGGLENLDDFNRCEIKNESDFKELFIDKFYFGCEADDRLNAVAFNEKINRGSKLNALYSSDVGHWDVPDMNQVVEAAYGLVEKGVMERDDFRRFTFENPARFWTSTNPDFFKGTRVEKQVAELLNKRDEQLGTKNRRPVSRESA